ncbi:flagellar hook-basal body complex protein FliE [Acetobacteraceae bacterium H6797]|nr:flagellar hook-basal body complex protein FliE [Acetobacteraceae bacterium H6797]
MVASLTPALAAAAYGGVAKTGGGVNEVSGGSDFGAALQRAFTQAVETGREADSTASAAMTGQTGITEAVLAVSKAELTLQTAVAMRDKVVSAYQEVMRMPI